MREGDAHWPDGEDDGKLVKYSELCRQFLSPSENSAGSSCNFQTGSEGLPADSIDGCPSFLANSRFAAANLVGWVSVRKGQGW